MTSRTSESWFSKKFVPHVKRFLKDEGLFQKAVLILDNALVHSPEDILMAENGDIFVLYFPANVTALV